MTSLWGEFECSETHNEEIIPAEIVKLFIMKAMQADGFRTPLSLPSKLQDGLSNLDMLRSDTLGLEVDDKVIHSVKLIQYAKEMTQLIEAAKEQTDLMVDSQIRTFPPALEIPVYSAKTPKCKLNYPLQYMDKEYRDFTLGIGSEIPEITLKTSKQLLKKSVATILAHVGYQNTKQSILNILTDVVEEYIIKMTELLRIAVDQGANFGATGFPDALERVFHEMNIGSVRCLHEYYQNKIINYHHKLLEECRTLNWEYNNISIPIKSETFTLNRIDKMEEQDDVPEIHFPAIGDEGVDELQPSLEPGFQMLHSLEQESNLQTIEPQEDDGNAITNSPSQELTSEILQTNFTHKRKRKM